MTLEVITEIYPGKPLHDGGSDHRELVSRVASSVTFEKSPRLRSFLLHVCSCAIDDKPEEATEQQIGIHVYGRPTGYNPSEDNIVRSQARVLRMKLEHHFANEGKDEPIIISIPKGQYLPIFEARVVETPRQIKVVSEETSKRRSYLRGSLIGSASLLALVSLWFGIYKFRSGSATPPPSGVSAPPTSIAAISARTRPSSEQRSAMSPGTGEIRIAAGHSGAPYVDMSGRRWESDRFFKGGAIQRGPTHFFPPVPDPNLFSTMREAVSADLMGAEDQRAFQYDIPLSPGVYELRLYFADPLRQTDGNQKEDAQNLRHMNIELNGHSLLADLDAIADAGYGAIDVRTFKDVQPSQDGKLHLEFRSRWGRPAFISGIELTPGSPGRLNPIRISTRQSGFADIYGIHWSGDEFFIEGRTWTQPKPPGAPKTPALYQTERHGNFSYAIPVPPGSYTVRLHFLESFFSPLVPEAFCHGVGCRVFDVTCNGMMLLQDFDIYQTAGDAFRPLVREFHGLHPDGQGKLVISFSPKVNYAEIRAIEVIDEAK